MGDPTLILGVLGLLLIGGIVALVVLVRMYRGAVRDAKISDERAQRIVRDAKAVVTSEQAILVLEEKIRDERHSPVPDLSMIRHWQKQLDTLREGQRELVEQAPWAK